MAGLHHVGVATDDAAGLAALYGDLLGLSVVHEETFDGMAVVFLGSGASGAHASGNGSHGPYLELLEPLDGEGPIARHLDRRGPGLHHLAVAVADVADALDRARALDVDPVDESPRQGAWGHEVAFLHPSSTGGVLVEFVEAEEAHDGGNENENENERGGRGPTTRSPDRGD